VSKRRLVITAVLAGQSQSEVARTYGVSQGWISRLMARYRDEGEAAFEPRSRAPKTTPGATAPETVELVLQLRKQLEESGLDAGADTIGWHLKHHYRTTLSRATINRTLTRAGAVTPPDPSKRPKSSYIRFEADQPNETWQSDFTHYRLTRPDGRPGADTEIISWLDDHDRVRHDKISKAGTVTLRVAGRLRHIGVGRTYAGTYVILLVQDLNVRVVHGATGELLRELTIDARRDYQPTGRPPGPTPK